jgi:hypothetical protein
MYDDDGALLGIGSFTIGGLVFDSVLVALVGFVVAAGALLLTRIGRGRG